MLVLFIYLFILIFFPYFRLHLLLSLKGKFVIRKLELKKRKNYKFLHRVELPWKKSSGSVLNIKGWFCMFHPDPMQDSELCKSKKILLFSVMITKCS